MEEDRRTELERFLKEALAVPGAKEMLDLQYECYRYRKIAAAPYRLARRRARCVPRTRCP